MGPENESVLTGYTVYSDGEPVKMGQLQEITLLEEAVAEAENFLAKIPEITVYLKTPKRWRCRSRKRFIKLVMSEGVSRNKAEWLERAVRMMRMSYNEAWLNYPWRKL